MKKKRKPRYEKAPEVGRRAFRVEESIFKRTVHVLVNYDQRQYARWAQRCGYKLEGHAILGEADLAGFSSEITCDSEPTEWLIVLKNFNWCIQDQGTLIHEITHTIIKIFHANNIPWSDQTQEFLAHDIGNLFEAIAHKLFYKRKAFKGEATK